jgi:hypothetical protein
LFFKLIERFSIIMKIEKPKCEEYVLFLASQSHTQRAVVKALSQCVNADDLQKALAGITFWPWDRVIFLSYMKKRVTKALM